MKKIVQLLVLICFMSLLCGCQSKTPQNNEENITVTTLGNVNWQQNGFRIESSNTAAYQEALLTPPLHEAAYKELPCHKPGFDYDRNSTLSACMDDTIYFFHCYEQGESIRYFFQSYGMGSDTEYVVEVSLPEEMADAQAIAVDIFDGKISVLLRRNEDEATSLWVLALDTTGEILTSNALKVDADVWDAKAPIYDFYTDGHNYCYLFAGTPQTGSYLYIYDEDGNFLDRQELLTADTGLTCNGFHTPDNYLLIQIPSGTGESSVLNFYEMPDAFPKRIATLDVPYVSYMTMTADGMIYLLKTSSLVKWDVTTGKQEPLFNFLQTDIDVNCIRHVGVNENGELLLLCQKDSNWSVYVLSEEVTEQEVPEVVLANITYEAPFLTKQAATFSRNNPDTKVVVKKDSGDMKAYRDRIMAEVSTGKGPDLLWLTIEDMRILQEKGALMDLRDLISEETLESVFPGVIASGTIDGELTGLFFDGAVTCLMTSNEIWEGTNWTTEDILSLAGNRDNLQGILGTDYNYSRGNILLEMALRNLDHSAFVDIAAGKSYFEKQEFIDLLETINRYGDTPSGGNYLEQVSKGEYMVYLPQRGINDLAAFSDTMKYYGDSCHFVGFPDVDGGYGYWTETFFLAVNANTKKRETISLFLEHLLSMDAQMNVEHLSVRRDAIVNSISVFEDNEGILRGNYRKGQSYLALELKEDGTTYLEEYLDFLDHCQPMPRSYESINEIILSGAEEYFNGQCTAERAAELIDNRVQLYLDEQR